MDIDVRDEHRRLTELDAETSAVLEASDASLARVEEDCSGWSAAQHLYHLWLSSSRSLHAVAMLHQGHEAVREEGSPNEPGRAVLETGRFPRGRMQAPESVRPPEAVDRDLLRETVSRSRAKLQQVEAILDDLPSVAGRLPHPRLGVLNASEWMRFIRIHAEHHMGIVREITKR